MARPLEATLDELTEIQRSAVEWDDGSLLVLAGPGSGKTRVLTCRVAHLLDQSRDRRFRVLALTFTNKAAHEMLGRVATLVPDLDERADIQTFHSFCADVLRQHGSHLGIRTDFEIYSRTADRMAVLEDALARDARPVDPGDLELLPGIQALKARLVSPEETVGWLASHDAVLADDPDRLARVYRLYEDELSRANALDFDSLILQAHRLFQHSAMTEHYQSMYRYWLVDEFQDTSWAQYELLRRMAGEAFRRIFVVADDDQTIYEWNGASIRRIGSFVKDFDSKVVQLPTNFRCPPQIVEAANRLAVYNVQRDIEKAPAEAAQRTRPTDSEPIRCLVFETNEDEAEGVAAEIAESDLAAREETLVLARRRKLLESLRDALSAKHVRARIFGRRDDFVSPEMRWMVACLKQINRPLDRRNLATLVEAFESFVASRPESLTTGRATVDFDDLISRSAADRVSYFEVWTSAVKSAGLPPPATGIVEKVVALANGELKLPVAVDQILEGIKALQPDGKPRDDLLDDLSAWGRLSRQIQEGVGPTSLDRFLQELELRSKEPSHSEGEVTLSTIHGAKGLEFDTVYVIGLAEEILPSWHSVKDGNGSMALDEERRNCFVAITRSKERLILSRAKRYDGWEKEPSQFLEEMGFVVAA